MKWIHRLIFALSICTISLVALYSLLGDTRKLEVTPDKFNIHVTNDAIAGGLSESDITYQNHSLTLNCDLKESKYACTILWNFRVHRCKRSNQGVGSF